MQWVVTTHGSRLVSLSLSLSACAASEGIHTRCIYSLKRELVELRRISSGEGEEIETWNIRNNIFWRDQIRRLNEISRINILVISILLLFFQRRKRRRRINHRNEKGYLGCYEILISNSSFSWNQDFASPLHPSLLEFGFRLAAALSPVHPRPVCLRDLINVYVSKASLIRPRHVEYSLSPRRRGLYECK